MPLLISWSSVSQSCSQCPPEASSVLLFCSFPPADTRIVKIHHEDGDLWLWGFLQLYEEGFMCICCWIRQSTEDKHHNIVILLCLLILTHRLSNGYFTCAQIHMCRDLERWKLLLITSCFPSWLCQSVNIPAMKLDVFGIVSSLIAEPFIRMRIVPFKLQKSCLFLLLSHLWSYFIIQIKLFPQPVNCEL